MTCRPLKAVRVAVRSGKSVAAILPVVAVVVMIVVAAVMMVAVVGEAAA